ncbi:hypothetical protein C1A40_13990 [Tamlana carrageenivorans]|uniref:Cell wall anchor protein n=2 Tax=Pseudotamlana carrageenivorans TaxID=2069432 RepID=A0A2I7SKW3_9FLAO|nr:hypothetical protein C1A40_13990 [Tamlana carrageenivorans]
MELLKNHLGEIITAIAGIGAWGFEHNKRKQELKRTELENNQSVIDLYQEALDDLKKRYDEKFSDLEVEIKSLKDNLNLWKGKYRTLKAEFDNYKKAHQ